MKKRLALSVFVLFAVGLCVSAGFAQSAGSVKGVVKDADGKIIPGAILVYSNQDTGQKFTITVDKKGEYYSLGITPGTYNVILYKNADDAKAGKELFHLNKFPVTLTENVLDLDLKKETEDAAKRQGVNPDQMKQNQEANEKVKKENNTIKALNEKINASLTAMKAGDYDTAVASMTEASQLDATRDVIWGLLADAYRGSALKQTDRAEKEKRLTEAIADYQKAIEIKQKAIETGPKKPEDNKQLAGYYNNLGDAFGRANKTDDAIKAYTDAAQANPENAAGYYFNAGAILTNVGKADDANAMFDKSIAADPTRAEAYYQKGVNLMGKATLQGDKTIPAPGTIEAFQKYLTLAPTGPNAQNAKDMLTSLGSPVETSFGKKKAGK